MMSQDKFSPASLWKSKNKSNTFVMVVMRHNGRVYYVCTKNAGTLYYKALTDMRDESVSRFRINFKWRINSTIRSKNAERYLALQMTKTQFLNSFNSPVEI